VKSSAAAGLAAAREVFRAVFCAFCCRPRACPPFLAAAVRLRAVELVDFLAVERADPEREEDDLRAVVVDLRAVVVDLRAVELDLRAVEPDFRAVEPDFRDVEPVLRVVDLRDELLRGCGIGVLLVDPVQAGLSHLEARNDCCVVG
jgi:hypothetical protein